MGASSPDHLARGHPSPSKLPLLMGIWTPSNTWFLGSIRLHNPNGISIGSAVLQGSRLWQTDRPTDRQNDRPCYAVCNNRPHLRTYMRPVVTDPVAWSVGRSVTVVSPAKRLNRLRCRLCCGHEWLQVSVYIWWGCTLAQPGEYHWTVHVRRRCGLMSNHFDQLLLLTVYSSQNTAAAAAVYGRWFIKNGRSTLLCQVYTFKIYVKKLISLKHCVRSQITRLKLQKSFCDLEHGASLWI